MTEYPPVARLLRWALEHLERRTPYVWAGKDPTKGLDCSGFVTAGLFAVGGPDWRLTHNTDRLWAECPLVRLDQARPGDAVLYWGKSAGPRDVSHVMLYVGEGIVVGQAYGGPENTLPSYSIPRGHWTKVLPLRYRPDVAGAVRLPFPVAPPPVAPLKDS
jgi:murein DD-endopeptidase